MTTVLLFLVIALWVVMIGQIAVTFALARQVGVLFERVTPVGAMISDAGPDIGAPAPLLTLPNLNGPEVTLGGATGGKSQLIFFLSTTCPICKALLPTLRSIRTAERDWLNVMLASDGKAAKHRDLIANEGLGDFAYVLSPELGQTFKVAKLPFAVLIDATGAIRAKGLINTREQLESLFTAAEMRVPSIQALAFGPSALPPSPLPQPN